MMIQATSASHIPSCTIDAIDLASQNPRVYVDVAYQGRVVASFRSERDGRVVSYPHRIGLSSSLSLDFSALASGSR